MMTVGALVKPKPERERKRGHLKILSYPNCTLYMIQEYMTPLSKPKTPISKPYRDLFRLHAARDRLPSTRD
jgi:hypothetical protein